MPFGCGPDAHLHSRLVALLQSPRRRFSIDMSIVCDEIEGSEAGVRGITTMHGLAAIADDHVFDHAPDDVVENRDAQQRETPSPGNENSADSNERDAGGAIEVLLEIELVVVARGAAINDRVLRGSDDLVRRLTVLARLRALPRFSRKTPFAFRAEEVDG